MKTNVNQRYATTGITNAILKVIAEKAEVPLQVSVGIICGRQKSIPRTVLFRTLWYATTPPAVAL